MIEKRFLPVDTNKDLVRDMQTKAVLNVNVKAFEVYKKSRDRARQIDQVMIEHEELKDELKEIKDLLLKLLNKA